MFRFVSFPKIAFRSYSTSRKIKIKSFDDVNIGDIISSSRDLKLYRIFAKHTQEYIYANSLTQYTERAQWLEGKSIKEKSSKTEMLTLSYNPTFLVLDKSAKEKFFHCREKDLKIGDIILHHGTYYRLLSLNFNVIEVDNYLKDIESTEKRLTFKELTQNTFVVVENV